MPVVDISTVDSVAVVTINNPPVNAFSIAVWSRLRVLLDRIAADEGTGVMVLTAAGERAFSAGADVKESAGLSAAEERDRHELVSGGLRQLGTLPIPIVCAINGAAVGGGLNIAALCDIRIASVTATFSLPEINHGRLAAGGAFVRRLGVPAGLINDMLFTGRRLSAAEALAAHLVNEVVPAAELMRRALDVAQGMAVKSRAALMTMKRAIQAAESENDHWSGYAAAERSLGVQS
jgi:enoyl-CoA hydratase/carnithine racemase